MIRTTSIGAKHSKLKGLLNSISIAGSDNPLVKVEYKGKFLVLVGLAGIAPSFSTWNGGKTKIVQYVTMGNTSHSDTMNKIDISQYTIWGNFVVHHYVVTVTIRI